MYIAAPNTNVSNTSSTSIVHRIASMPAPVSSSSCDAIRIHGLIVPSSHLWFKKLVIFCFFLFYLIFKKKISWLLIGSYFKQLHQLTGIHWLHFHQDIHRNRQCNLVDFDKFRQSNHLHIGRMASDIHPTDIVHYFHNNLDMDYPYRLASMKII